jgi:enamine deaminase RidA (YjgF/YER057c/UK114 family)
LVFVEWIASAPVEIELIAHLPLTGTLTESVRYYNPPGVQASPTFSRAALIQTERQIYISGLAGRAAGDGQAQVRDVFAQLNEILGATGSDLRHLAKATYYVSDEDASTMLNKLRPEFFDPQRPPAASKATVHGVGHPDRTLSLDMIAVEAR